MKIKRYTGTHTREVLTRIRNDLGADAVILSNREIVGGVELMAAVDFDASRFPSEEHEPDGAAASVSQPPVMETAPAPAPASTSMPTTAQPRTVVEPMPRPSPQPQPTDLPLPAVARVVPTAPPRAAEPASAPTSISLEEKDAAVLGAIRPAQATAVAPPRPAHSVARPEPKDELGAMRHELQDLRQWMQSQMSGLADAGPLTPTGEQLQALGFSTARARQLGSQALNLRGALAAYLGKGLQVAADPVSAAGIYALVGPTGAGKTTTIAKLAARLVLRNGTGAVALITTDTYRIGGVEQLKIYGRILGVPVAVARDGEELQQHLRDFADRHYVLIDSIGLSPRDVRMAEQMQWLQALGDGVTRLLVVGAGLAPSAYAELWTLYRRLPVAAAILTKLDESPSFGAALQWLVESSVPLWFYTDGQRVPEDLHVPSLAKITALLEHDPVTRFDSAPALSAAAAAASAAASPSA
ncbi:MAG: flagellar biosynthesis protein FlhF [Thiomonas sp.]|nr:flagellar biosynthesis protein FlhF [Thiomonas sp.]